VKDIVVVPTPVPGLGPQGAVAGAHFFIQDKGGKSIVVEPVDGTLDHDAPLGVMTNAPTYDWHMTNLQNYINLCQGCGAGQARAGHASGLRVRLLTPPSRFVRTAIYSQSAAPNATAQEAVLSAFHILNQFDIPEGAVENGAVGELVNEVTEWTSVADLKNSALVLQDRDDQSIHMIDLKQAANAAKGETRVIQMEGSTQSIANASTNGMAGK
jgi:choloylglycine hydrolase